MNDATIALLTEHFSYTPLSLIDDVINSVNNLIYQAISSLETGLLSTPPGRLGFSHAANGTIPDTDEDGNVEYPEARLEIENGLHQLETLLESTVDKAFDKFEIYVLRNIFTVPEDLLASVRLKHYEGLQFTPSPDAPTPDSILRQRKQLHETRKLNRALKHEKARNDAVIAQLRSILSTAESGRPQKTEDDSSDSRAIRADNENGKDVNLSFLTNCQAARQLRVGAAGADTKHTPLTTNTTFILSQLPALQSMLKQLRPKLSSLPRSADLMDAEPKTDERTEYIESRIRLHLERTGQLGVGGDGPVVAGRRIDISEAQALEVVTGMLRDTSTE